MTGLVHLVEIVTVREFPFGRITQVGGGVTEVKAPLGCVLSAGQIVSIPDLAIYENKGSLFSELLIVPVQAVRANSRNINLLKSHANIIDMNDCTGLRRDHIVTTKRMFQVCDILRSWPIQKFWIDSIPHCRMQMEGWSPTTVEEF